MKQIDSLTPEQEAQLAVYRDKWIKIGLSTEPLDFEKSKKAVCLAYRLADLPEPTKFFTAKSPADAIRVIKELDPTKSSSDIALEMTYGCHDAHWLGFYEYFRDVLNIEECHKLDGLIDLAYHCGWVSMYEDTVVFQERPESIKFDDQNRLHCENGPAIRYPDGYSVYSWHGVQVPEEWIESKGTLSPEVALTWENVEQRRAACEIIGWATIIRKLDAQVIDCDEDPEVGTLLEVNIPEIGKERFLKVRCGTGREFALPVPPDMTSALEANAWTFGLLASDLMKLEVRT
jgi:hypothetical protein